MPLTQKIMFSPSGKHLSYYVLMSGDEWVFFNAAQVLPCYVVQIMSSSTHTHNLPPLAGLQDLGAGDDSTDTAAVALKKKQAKLLARVHTFLTSAISVLICSLLRLVSSCLSGLVQGERQS